MPDPLLTLLFFLQPLPVTEVPHFSCGPFLLQPGPREMTVVVDHEHPVPARLRYWTADDGGERSLQHGTSGRHHVFTLEGLEPDTVYSYEITADALSSGIHEFRTLPDSPQRYRVLVMGDVRTQADIWAQVSERMFEHEHGALFAIGTGDYPTDGRRYRQWVNEFFAPARSFLGHLPIWPVIGNHELTRRHDDVTEMESSHFFSLFELPGNERWYRVDYHLMTLLVLDSNSHMTPDGPQYRWLRDQLRSPRNRFTIATFHHAPLTSGPHGQVGSDGTPLEWALDEARRFLVPLFGMYDVDLVLTGHDHIYERSEKGGVVYIVTGGGGAPLYETNHVENPYQQVAVSTHHYVALDIDASGIELTAIDKDGAVIDSARVPATDSHVERRTRSVARALEGATDFGPLDVSTHVAQVVLSNPFDHPLTVEITTTRRGNLAQPLQETLAAGERRELSWQVEEIGGDLEAEPWRAAVALDLRMHFRGRDQALDLDLDLRRRVTVYHPTYATRRLESVVADGDLSEWNDVTSMAADEQTPIVRRPSSYEGPGDFGAQVRLAWSDGWLHLAADITDERVVDDGTSDIDDNDCVRVLFDIPTGPSQGVAVFSFGASGRADSTASDSEVRYVTRAREGGWVLEASFPFHALGLERAETRDAEISCDLLFVDRDLPGDDARPSYHRFWTRSRSRFDTSTFGALILKN